METTLQLGLSNALGAALLAVPAAVVSIWCRRRPALAHCMWLLVLLKLVTPPVVWVTVPWPISNGRETVVESVEEPPAAAVEFAAADEMSGEMDVPTPAVAVVPVSLSNVVGGIWLVGSVGWFVLAGWRLNRFRMLLREARPAPADLQFESARLAASMGVRRAPRVWLIPGSLPPMLWAGPGRAKLLLPAELLATMDADQQATLLVHELAHLRRGDHWVRRIEFLALGLYWWNPVAWLVSRQLRDAEEQCCDGWVVQTLPEGGSAYARALLATIDFLSTVPTAAPPLASGFGPASDLKRRLTMILSASKPGRLRYREGVALLTLALLLPLVPGLVRANPDDGDENGKIKVVIGEPDAAAELEKAKAELQKSKAELEKKLAELKVAQAKIEMAAKKLADEQEAKAKEQAAKAAKATADKKEKDGKFSIVFTTQDGKEGKGTIAVKPVEGKPAEAAAASGQFVIVIDGQKLPVIMGDLKGQFGGKALTLKAAAAEPASRLDKIERSLMELQKELSALRRDLDTKPTPAAEPAATPKAPKAAKAPKGPKAAAPVEPPPAPTPPSVDGPKP